MPKYQKSVEPLPDITVVDRDIADAILTNPRLRQSISWVISIGDPGCRVPCCWNQIEASRRLRLEFLDISRPFAGYDPPTTEDIRNLIAFSKRAVEGRVLVHCAAGISRSTAAALILLTVREGSGKEGEALESLLRNLQAAGERGLRDKAEFYPNIHMIRVADELLERKGVFLRTLLDYMLPRHPYYGQE